MNWTGVHVGIIQFNWMTTVARHCSDGYDLAGVVDAKRGRKHHVGIRRNQGIEILQTSVAGPVKRVPSHR